MLAAQAVATHCAIMDNFRYATRPDTPPLLAMKFRANSVTLNRMFCLNLRELAHLQARPLLPRPGQNPEPSGDGPPPGNPPQAVEAATAKTPRARANASPGKVADPAEAISQSAADPVSPPTDPPDTLQDIAELPEDIETRPDGTPGNLTAYAPKLPVEIVIPREAPIMVALATRPKPWRMVNVPKDQAPTAGEETVTPATPVQEAEHQVPRGPVDLLERMFTGDALARFAGTRLDPDAPDEPFRFEHEDSVVELELISTGGDPSAEAHLAAMMAAHPEGKPIVTFRHGTRLPPGAKLSNGKDEPPTDT